MKILHIDDSPEICKLYEDMFTLDHHSTTSVSNGKQGLELVVKNDYDVIFLDVCMPNYSGMDFLADLKNTRPSELKKVILLSVLEYNQSQVKGFLKFGIHSVERKPCNSKKLEVIIKNSFF